MNKLVAYIKANGTKAFEKDGKLFAENVYTMNGEVYSELEEIEPTIKAVRIWLGY